MVVRRTRLLLGKVAPDPWMISLSVTKTPDPEGSGVLFCAPTWDILTLDKYNGHESLAETTRCHHLSRSCGGTLCTHLRRTRQDDDEPRRHAGRHGHGTPHRGGESAAHG